MRTHNNDYPVEVNFNDKTFTIHFEENIASHMASGMMYPQLREIILAAIFQDQFKDSLAKEYYVGGIEEKDNTLTHTVTSNIPTYQFTSTYDKKKKEWEHQPDNLSLSELPMANIVSSVSENLKFAINEIQNQRSQNLMNDVTSDYKKSQAKTKSVKPSPEELEKKQRSEELKSQEESKRWGSYIRNAPQAETTTPLKKIANFVNFDQQIAKQEQDMRMFNQKLSNLKTKLDVSVDSTLKEIEQLKSDIHEIKQTAQSKIDSLNRSQIQLAANTNSILIYREGLTALFNQQKNPNNINIIMSAVGLTMPQSLASKNKLSQTELTSCLNVIQAQLTQKKPEEINIIIKDIDIITDQAFKKDLSKTLKTIHDSVTSSTQKFIENIQKEASERLQNKIKLRADRIELVIGVINKENSILEQEKKISDYIEISKLLHEFKKSADTFQKKIDALEDKRDSLSHEIKEILDSSSQHLLSANTSINQLKIHIMPLMPDALYQKLQADAVLTREDFAEHKIPLTGISGQLKEAQGQTAKILLESAKLDAMITLTNEKVNAVKLNKEIETAFEKSKLIHAEVSIFFNKISEELLIDEQSNDIKKAISTATDKTPTTIELVSFDIAIGQLQEETTPNKVNEKAIAIKAKVDKLAITRDSVVSNLEKTEEALKQAKVLYQKSIAIEQKKLYMLLEKTIKENVAEWNKEHIISGKSVYFQGKKYTVPSGMSEIIKIMDPNQTSSKRNIHTFFSKKTQNTNPNQSAVEPLSAEKVQDHLLKFQEIANRRLKEKGAEKRDVTENSKILKVLGGMSKETFKNPEDVRKLQKALQVELPKKEKSFLQKLTPRV